MNIRSGESEIWGRRVLMQSQGLFEDWMYKIPSGSDFIWKKSKFYLQLQSEIKGHSLKIYVREMVKGCFPFLHVPGLRDGKYHVVESEANGSENRNGEFCTTYGSNSKRQAS